MELLSKKSPFEGMPSLYEHTDFRLYLRRYAEVRRQSSPRWSYGVWARQLNLGGTASLTMVLNGQRLPGSEMTRRLVDYFGFRAKEAQFFRDLIDLERFKDVPTSYAQVLSKVTKQLKERGNTDATLVIEEDKLNRLSSWYYIALREMVKLSDFRPNATWIAQRLGKTVDQGALRRAFDELKQLGIIRRDPRSKRWTPVEKTLSIANASLRSMALRALHRQFLGIAERAIDGVPSERRLFLASVLTVRKDAVPKVLDLIESFQEELSQLVEVHDEQFGDDRSNGGDDIYQCSIQFVPLTVPASVRIVSSKE